MSQAMLSRESIEVFVVDTLVNFGIDRSLINHDATFDELGVDSLDVVELLQALKKP